MSDFLLNLVESFLKVWNFVGTHLLTGIALLAVFILLHLFLRIRHSVVIEPWENLSPEDFPALSQNFSEILLYGIHHIKHIHRKTMHQIDLWNPYTEIPAFQQDLDKKLEFISAVPAGKYGAIFRNVLKGIVQLLPYLFPATRLKGSAMVFGEEVLFQVRLENYKGGRGEENNSFFWQIRGKVARPESFPDLIEQLGYEVYLALSPSRLFTSGESFKEYTVAIDHHIAYNHSQKESEYQEALLHYEKSRAVQPINPAAAYNMGVLKYFRYKSAANEEAIQHFRECLKSTDKHLRALGFSGLANALCQKHHRYNQRSKHTLADAIYFGEEAIKILPDSDFAHKALAFAYHQFAELDDLTPSEKVSYRKKAIFHYQKAYKQNRANYMAHNNLGNLYLEWARDTGDLQEKNRLLENARKECQAAVELQPDYYFAFDNLGNVYREMADFLEAERNFKIALRINPDYVEAMNDLAILYLHPDNPERDPVVALQMHLEALSEGGVAVERLKKLCAQFQSEMEKAVPISRKSSAQLEHLISQLEDKKCKCVSESGRAEIVS